MTPLLLIAITLVLSMLAWRAVELHKLHQRELGRFSGNLAQEDVSFEKRIDRLFETLGRKLSNKKQVQYRAKLAEKDMNARLRSAGLESVSDHGKFIFVRIVCVLAWLVVMLTVWRHLSAYFAGVWSVFSFGFMIVGPELWLSRKSIRRVEDIQRELPLVVDLTNLATSAGWDVSAALERVIEALAPEFPNHPLLKELKRAKWLATSGYTWREALDRVSRKMNDDTVTRVNLALVQAMEQGGDRSSQLAGIAEDAQRAYAAALTKRLSSLPVKAIVIMVLLFLTYFVVLLSPAMVGVSTSF